MKLARITLTIAGLVFVLHGTACLIYPELITSESALLLQTRSSYMEVRAEYGGLPIALGLLFLLGAFRKEMLDTVMVTFLTITSGYIVGRLIAVSLETEIDVYNLAALAYEGPMFLLALFYFFRIRQENARVTKLNAASYCRTEQLSAFRVEEIQ